MNARETNVKDVTWLYGLLDRDIPYNEFHTIIASLLRRPDHGGLTIEHRRRIIGYFIFHWLTESQLHVRFLEHDWCANQITDVVTREMDARLVVAKCCTIWVAAANVPGQHILYAHGWRAVREVGEWMLFALRRHANTYITTPLVPSDSREEVA